MLKSDGFSEQIRGQDIYLRALMTINQLAAMTYTSTSNEWQRNVLNYEAAIEALEAQVGPFLPKNYPQKIRALKKRAREIKEKAKEGRSPFEMMRVGKDLEVKLTRAMANERLKLIVICLHEKNLLVPTNYNGIEDDPDEYAEDDEGDIDGAPFADGTPINTLALGEESCEEN